MRHGGSVVSLDALDPLTEVPDLAATAIACARGGREPGILELAIPKLPSGSYFPHSLLERRRRAEQALISVVTTAYLLGMSTRCVE